MLQQDWATKTERANRRYVTGAATAAAGIEGTVKTFKCGACGNTVYFENMQCLRCGHALGFRSERLEMATLVPSGNELYREFKKGSATRLRYCANEAQGVCNWLVRDDANAQFCKACELNRTIPNLAEPANVTAWGDFDPNPTPGETIIPRNYGQGPGQLLSARR